MRSILIAAAALAFAPVAMATDITVMFSPDFAEALEDDYGVREGARLAEHVERHLTTALEKSGTAPARIDVTILDAMPNKPTMQQLGDQPGLDFGNSISIGGMDLKATVYDADGNALTDFEYDWYQNDIRWAGLGIWSDARTASRRFARRFVQTLDAG